MGMDIFWDNEKRVKRSWQYVIVQGSSYIPSFSSGSSVKDELQKEKGI